MHQSSSCLFRPNSVIILLCLFGTSSSLECYECRSKTDCEKGPLRIEECKAGPSYYLPDGTAKEAVCGVRSRGNHVREAGCGPDMGYADKECKGEDCVLRDNKEECKITRCTCHNDLCNTKRIVSSRDAEAGGVGSVHSSLFLEVECLIAVFFLAYKRR